MLEAAGKILTEFEGINSEKLRLHGIEPTSWKSVLQRERPRALDLLSIWGDSAEERGEPLILDAIGLRVELLRWMSVSYHHRDGKRKSKEDYSIHLWETAKGAARYGFTEKRIITGGKAHDAGEDIEAVRKRQLPLFFTSLLDTSSLSGIQAEDDEIRGDVDAVTKPENEDKDLRSRQYLELLIRGLLKDPRPILIKLFDRRHNMLTLEHMRPEKQLSIAQETLDVFVPLARILGLYDLQEELLRLCLKYLNPSLVKELDTFIERRFEKIEGSAIWQQIQSLEDTPGVQRICLEPHKIVSRTDVLSPGTRVEAATFKDLGLKDPDPFVWVTFTVENEADILPVAQAIQAQLPGQRWEFGQSYGFKRGMSVKTFAPEYKAFGGRAFFRVNTARSDKNSRRGEFSNGSLALPEVIRTQVPRVLERTDRGEDIRNVVQEVLLHPTVRISIFEEGEVKYMELKTGTTGRELYKMLHGEQAPEDLSVKLQRNLLSNPLEATALEVNPDAPLPNGFTILF